MVQTSKNVIRTFDNLFRFILIIRKSLEILEISCYNLIDLILFVRYQKVKEVFGNEC